MSTYSYILGTLFTLLTTLYTTHVDASAIQARIISGTPARTGQFPWQVIIKKDNYDPLLCGGSIISDYWVLTAAHCTYGYKSLLLVFGTIDRKNNINTMISNRFHIHPQYNSEHLTNDISLIELPTPLKFTQTIQPIPLVNWLQASNSYVGYPAIIAGFGLIDDEYLEYSDILLWAEVEIITNSDCAEAYGEHIIKDTSICSKGDGNSNKAICSGDSGGPLITKVNDTMVQIGINRVIAEDSCTEGYPSVYVRLSSYLTFISSVTGLTFF